MTEKEAIEVLAKNVPKCCKWVGSRYKGGFDDWDCDMGQAIAKAIKALEEIQQYREIGTVEECRAAVEKLPVAEEAIRNLLCSEYGSS